MIFLSDRLKARCSKWTNKEDAVVSPVDAVIEDIGTITMDHEMMVKGKSYSIPEMLGGMHKRKNIKMAPI